MHAFWIDPDHLVAETYYARREEEWGKRGCERERGREMGKSGDLKMGGLYSF